MQPRRERSESATNAQRERNQSATRAHLRAQPIGWECIEVPRDKLDWNVPKANRLGVYWIIILLQSNNIIDKPVMIMFFNITNNI